MPYDLTSDNPWENDDWTFSTVPLKDRVTANKRWKTAGLNDEHLTLCHCLLPDYKDVTCESEDLPKAQRNTNLRAWRKVAVTALLKHSIFDNLVRHPGSTEAERSVAYVEIEAKLTKKFHNHQYQKAAKKTSTTEPSRSAAPDTDNNMMTVSSLKDFKLLVQLLKLLGTISAQKIFDDINREAIQTRVKQLIATNQIAAGNPGGADRHALKQLWEEISDEEWSQYEQMALEAVQNIETSELPGLMFQLLKELACFLGPAAFMFVFACCDATGTINLGINVSTNQSCKIPDAFGPTFGSLVRDWASKHLPDDAHRHQSCKPDLSYDDLSCNPEDYYDTVKWASLAPITCAPMDMDVVQTLLLAKFFKEKSNENVDVPFQFYEPHPMQNGSEHAPTLSMTAAVLTETPPPQPLPAPAPSPSPSSLSLPPPPPPSLPPPPSPSPPAPFPPRAPSLTPLNPDASPINDEIDDDLMS
ncbi:uncharacterized protein ARMOST_06236 [Armillaria ostoyae]|uniref:Uncharacterized protein n=1 Tax=Armillaria ostoyae TaxID=47428 RepID=A0A284R2I1_ARMOS|nr:uncharacterized protein ARMOST_06236 [Armillaria ostoyae]